MRAEAVRRHVKMGGKVVVPVLLGPGDVRPVGVSRRRVIDLLLFYGRKRAINARLDGNGILWLGVPDPHAEEEDFAA